MDNPRTHADKLAEFAGFHTFGAMGTRRIILNGTLLLTLAVLSSTAFGQSKAEKRIRTIMDQQSVAWSAGDIDAFMQPYWKSDSLMFIGKSGVNLGWQTTLDNYKRSYPDASAMGKLTFTIIDVEAINRKTAYVIGKWHLTREAGDLEGHYTLLWKKIKGEWVIVSDHSS